MNRAEQHATYSTSSSTYKSYNKSDVNQRLTKRRYTRSRSRSYSRTRSSYSRSRSRSFSRSPSRGRNRNSPVKDKPIRKRSYTRSRSRSPYSSRSDSPSFKKSNINERHAGHKYNNYNQRNRSKTRSPAKKYQSQANHKVTQSSYQQQLDTNENYKSSVKSYNSQYQSHQPFNRNNKNNYNYNQRSRSRSKGKSTSSASLLSRINGKSTNLPANTTDHNLNTDKSNSRHSPNNRSRSRSPNKKNAQFHESSSHALKQSIVKVTQDQSDDRSLELLSTSSLRNKTNRSSETLEGKSAVPEVDRQKVEHGECLNEVQAITSQDIKTGEEEKKESEKPKSEKKEKKRKHHKREKSDKREKSKKEAKHKKSIPQEGEKQETNLELAENQPKQQQQSLPVISSVANENVSVEKIKKHSSNTKIKLSRSNGEKRRSSTNLLVSTVDGNELRHRNVKLSGIKDEKTLIDNSLEESEKFSKKKKTTNSTEPFTIITTTTLNEILNKETDKDKEKANSSKQEKEKSKDKKSKHKSKKKKHKHKHRSSSKSPSTKLSSKSKG
jgi:E3 ubiquitin-protein ligase RBBP6